MTDHPDLHTLLDLNRAYVRAAQNTDLAWYQAHLADSYMSRSPDATLTDKAGFLQRIASQAGGGWLMEPVDPQVQFEGSGEGAVALIHSGFRMWRTTGSGAQEESRGYYTDIWCRKSGRWLCIMAHFSMP